MDEGKDAPVSETQGDSGPLDNDPLPESRTGLTTLEVLCAYLGKRPNRVPVSRLMVMGRRCGVDIGALLDADLLLSGFSDITGHDAQGDA
jgi:hypothetical protein